MTALWPLCALWLAAPPVALEDPADCVDEHKLRAELDALLPAEIDASGRVRIDVRVAEPLRVHLRVHLEGEAPPLIDRRIPLERADCPSAAPLLARIVARRLMELPAGTWTAPSEAPPLRGSVGLGLAVPALRGALDANLAIGLGAGVYLAVGAGARLWRPVEVGAGEATITTVLGSLEVGWSAPVGAGLSLEPSVRLSAGVHVATGDGFDTSERAVLPALAAAAALTLRTAYYVYVSAGVSIPLLVPRLVEEGTDATFTGSPIQALVTLGVAFGGVQVE